MLTETQIASILEELGALLRKRAKAKGLKPGEKAWMSYVHGTLDRERARLNLALTREARGGTNSRKV
jgi:hypothetical protein